MRVQADDIVLARRALGHLPQDLGRAADPQRFDRWSADGCGALSSSAGMLQDPHEALYYGLVLGSGVAIDVLTEVAAAGFLGWVRRLTGRRRPPLPVTAARLQLIHRRIVRAMRDRRYTAQQAMTIADAVIAVLATDDLVLVSDPEGPSGPHDASAE